MIWHIFRKDLRVLWPMAVVVAVIQCLTAGALASHGEFERGMNAYTQYGWLSGVALPTICLLGLVILTVAVVQQDRLPGATQDWLTRPIPRRYLFAAKMLFILVIGLGPVLLADLMSGLAEQLRWSDVLAASLTRTLVLYGLVCLPALLVSIVTRSLTEALVFTLGVVVVLGIEMIVLAQTGLQLPLTGSGYGWTVLLALLLTNLIAVVVMLPLQLRWRATNRMRWAAAAYLCAAPAVMFLPWGVGFGLQQALDGHVGQPNFSVTVDAARKVAYTVPGKRRVPGEDDTAKFVTLALPVNVSPSDAEQVWQLDYARIRLIDPISGFSLGSASAQLNGNPLGPWVRGARPEMLEAELPVGLFRAARDRHATVSATLYMTTYRLQIRTPVASLTPGSIDEFSRCRLTDRQLLRCVSTRPVGTCASVVEAMPAGPRRRPALVCRGATYTPWPLPMWRDPYYTYVFPNSEVGIQGMAMADGEGPMTTAERNASTKVRLLSNYVPAAHFIRTVEFSLAEVTEGSLLPEPRSRDGVGSAARFAAPAGLAADSHGNVFTVDQIDSIVRKITPSGEVTTFAGRTGQTGRSDGQGSDALFDHPRGIAVDAADNLYVADTGNKLIRRISPAGSVSTVAGAGSATDGSGRALLNNPTEIICAHGGAIYVVDHNEDGAVIRQVLPDGVLKTIAGPDEPTSSE